MAGILVIGSLNMDFAVGVEEMPRKGETVKAKSFGLICGGKGANQACAAGRLGAETHMLGAVGRDNYGDTILESLKNSGVKTGRVKIDGGTSTGMAIVTVNKQGENCITVIPGANATVDCGYIDENRDLIAECDCVVLQLEIPLETVVYAAKMAESMGKTVILDPAPVPERLPEELLECVSIIKPNEIELERLTGIPVSESTMERACRELMKRGAENVIVTLGSGGAFACLKDGTACRIKGLKVTAVDTTAAGDSFSGALAAALVKGDALPQALEFANKVSGVVVTRKGAQSSLPDLSEVENFYKGR